MILEFRTEIYKLNKKKTLQANRKKRTNYSGVTSETKFVFFTHTFVIGFFISECWPLLSGKTNRTTKYCLADWRKRVYAKWRVWELRFHGTHSRQNATLVVFLHKPFLLWMFGNSIGWWPYSRKVIIIFIIVLFLLGEPRDVRSLDTENNRA